MILSISYKNWTLYFVKKISLTFAQSEILFNIRDFLNFSIFIQEKIFNPSEITQTSSNWNFEFWSILVKKILLSDDSKSINWLIQIISPKSNQIQKIPFLPTFCKKKNLKSSTIPVFSQHQRFSKSSIYADIFYLLSKILSLRPWHPIGQISRVSCSRCI